MVTLIKRCGSFRKCAVVSEVRNINVKLSSVWMTNSHHFNKHIEPTCYTFSMSVSSICPKLIQTKKFLLLLDRFPFSWQSRRKSCNHTPCVSSIKLNLLLNIYTNKKVRKDKKLVPLVRSLPSQHQTSVWFCLKIVAGKTWAHVKHQQV